MRTDFDPAAARRVALREGLALAAHGVMMPLGFVRSRHRTRRQRDLRTIVFVHGLAANRATFYPMQGWLRLIGYDQQLSVNHRSGPSIEALGIELRRSIDARVKGGRIDLIAHSLGGLIARVYLQMLGGARRVDRLITLGTPHQGTYASMFVPTRFVRQLEPEGPFITDLNSRPAPAGVTSLSIAAGSDALILPRTSAVAPFGESLTIDGLGHTGMLMSPTVFSTVRRALEAPAQGISR